MRREAKETIKTFEEYELEIEESMAWYKLNSYVNNTSKESDIQRNLDRDCLDKKGSKCYIKTGCLYFINRRYLDLEYKSDSLTSTKADKIQSLDDFIKNGEGDCEDYALFYKAELNYILEECKDIAPENIIFESYYIDEKSSDRYWLDYDRHWYLDEVTEISFNSYIYPNVVCGYIYDLNLNEDYEHCVITLTKNRIERIEDINLELDGAPLIEPQDGSFIGYINKNSYGENYAVSVEDITDIITDTDHYHKTQSSDWLCYSFFKNKLKEQQNKLISMLNK